MTGNQNATRRGDQFILSVRPEWVKKILAGQKIFEVRKTGPQLLPGGATVWIYETATNGGRGKVVARFNCPRIHRASGWHEFTRYARGSCLTENDLAEYQGMRGALCFWEIEAVEELEVPLGVVNFGLPRPPQSWCRVPRGMEW